MSGEYYDREMIDLFHKELQGKLRSQDDLLQKIYTQTKATNGRVSKLENWRAYMMGINSVIAFLVGVMGLWIIQQIL